MDSIDGIINGLLADGYGDLDRFFRDLVTVERDPDDLEAIARMTGVMESIAQTYRLLGLTSVQSVPDAAVDLLRAARLGAVRVDAEVAGALLAAQDIARRALLNLDGHGVREREDHAGLLAKLRRLQGVLQR
jgi:chemotaxis protein histidine kinase CheA